MDTTLDTLCSLAALDGPRASVDAAREALGDMWRDIMTRQEPDPGDEIRLMKIRTALATRPR